MTDAARAARIRLADTLQDLRADLALMQHDQHLTAADHAMVEDLIHAAEDCLSELPIRHQLVPA